MGTRVVVFLDTGAALDALLLTLGTLVLVSLLHQRLLPRRCPPRSQRRLPLYILATMAATAVTRELEVFAIQLPMVPTALPVDARTLTGAAAVVLSLS